MTMPNVLMKKDKNSFGCSNENDWTYFGDAYFNHALRTTYSFVDAFNLAKPMIATREKKEEFDSSNPQIFVGNGIRDKLAAFEQQLKTHEQGSTMLVAMHTNPEPQDKIQQYVNLVYDPKSIKEKYDACLANMYDYGPDALLEKNPDYFSGLNKSSRRWPELANAWNHYADSYCEQLYGGDLMRNLYTKYIRANVSPSDLTPVLKFLNSDSGKRWFPAEKEVMRQMTAAMTKVQVQISMPLSKTYREEEARVLQEYRADKKASSNKAQ